MKTIEERLAQIEARLERIERVIPAMPVAGAGTDRPVETAGPAAEKSPGAGRPSVAAPQPARRVVDPKYGVAAPGIDSALSVTQILGWTGALTLGAAR